MKYLSKINTKNQFIVNVEAFISHEDRYLMIKRSELEEHAPGVISPPGGKVEQVGNFSNVLEQTVKREIKEEVNVEIEESITYVQSNSFVTDDDRSVIDIVFLCQYLSGEPEALDPQEVESVQWMSAQEILDHPKTPSWTQEHLKLVEQKRRELR